MSRVLMGSSGRAVRNRYFALAVTSLLAGGALALLLRAELNAPGLQWLGADLFQRLVSAHAMLLLFGAMLAGWTGVAIAVLPSLSGRTEAAWLPALRWAFWALLGGCVATALSPWLAAAASAPIAGVAAGLAPGLLGIALTLIAASVVVTLLDGRERSVRQLGIPGWLWLAAAAMFALGGVALLSASTSAGPETLAGGRDTWRRLYPVAYAMLLPGFAVVSEILPARVGRPLSGASSAAWAMASISVLTLIGWSRYLPAALPLPSELLRMYVWLLLAVPAGVVVWSWLATVRALPSRLDVSLLFALGFVVTFAVTVIVGIGLSLLPLAARYQGSQLVSAHIHVALIGSSGFALFAAIYHWLPAWVGCRFEAPMALLHFCGSALGLGLLCAPLVMLGAAGMPRRVADYEGVLADPNVLATLGGLVFAAAQLVFCYVAAKAAWFSAPAAMVPRPGTNGNAGGSCDGKEARR